MKDIKPRIFTYSIFFSLLILLACNNDGADFLSGEQKLVSKDSTFGKTFTILNNTDTFKFVVSKADYDSESNEKWHENFDSNTWADEEHTFFKTTHNNAGRGGNIGDNNYTPRSLKGHIHTSTYQKVDVGFY